MTADEAVKWKTNCKKSSFSDIYRSRERDTLELTRLINEIKKENLLEKNGPKWCKKTI